MENKHKQVDEYLEKIEGVQRQWLMTFVEHMRTNYPELEEVISFQMPTYKLGSGKQRNYISSGTGKNHFSLHTMDFDYISSLKERLTKPGKGKGCVNVLFSNMEEQEILFEAISEIIQRKVMSVYGK